ncbi:RNA pseudouridine synthase [bacterium]|nr:RNA pseudouridine synthase [bacterium]
MSTLEPTVLFEDSDVLVIDKPVGIAVHGDGQPSAPTVVDWLLGRAPEARGVGEPQTNQAGEAIERSGVVHRLDRDTSGVMVLAKTPAAYEHLKQQFHDRLAKKEYRALVYGHLNERWGTVDRPIGRSAKDWRLRSAQRGAKGTLRDAVTDWELIGQGEYETEPFAYVRLKPKTGRMHQIRVHLKAIDRPIVGDVLYAGAKREQSNNLGLTRLALHAHVLELTLPSGEEQRFVAPVPPELEQAVDELHEPAT